MSDLADLYRYFSEHSTGDYAPTYRAITAAIADDPELLGVVQAAPPEAHHPTVVLAAVKYLLVDEPHHPLASIYRGDGGDVVGAFTDFVRTQRSEILDVMAVRRTQTNEVARTAVLGPALAEVQRRHAEPMALLDVGTSAGLNLLVDRVAIDYGRFRTGPENSSVSLASALVNDGPEPWPPLDIDWRCGLDRAPIDLEDPDQVRWLEACIWPDNPARVSRFRSAVELWLAHPTPLERGDAIDDLARVAAPAPDDQHLTVMTSWVSFYFDKAHRLAFEAAVAALGRPVSWISVEFPGVVRGLDNERDPVRDDHEQSVVVLVEHDGLGGSTREQLAWCHPHGLWLDWE